MDYMTRRDGGPESAVGVAGKSGGDKSHVSQSPAPEAEVVTIMGKNSRNLLWIVYSLYLIL